MALHAVENLDDALDATRTFLLPFRARDWLKLAFVVVFISTGMGFPSTGFDVSTPGEPISGTEIPWTFSTDFMVLVGILVGAGLLFALLWGFVGSIMEFVFFESLRNESVTIRAYWGSRWRQGVRLFVFRLLIALPVLVIFLGWLALVFVPLYLDAVAPGVPIALFLLGIPALIVVSLVFTLIHGFTTLLVVPIMILEDCGVLAGWRRLWSSIREDWKQYLVFAVMYAIVAFVLGLLAAFVVGFAALLLLIPFVGLGLAVYFAVPLTTTIGMISIALLVLLFVLVAVVIWAVVQVPVLSYLRYYTLLVLGDVDDSLDLIPERRGAIRNDD